MRVTAGLTDMPAHPCLSGQAAPTSVFGSGQCAGRLVCRHSTSRGRQAWRPTSTELASTCRLARWMEMSPSASAPRDVRRDRVEQTLGSQAASDEAVLTHAASYKAPRTNSKYTTIVRARHGRLQSSSTAFPTSRLEQAAQTGHCSSRAAETVTRSQAWRHHCRCPSA